MTDKTREDFESWLVKRKGPTGDTPGYPGSPPFFHDQEAAAFEGYQAATQHSAARIAELEAAVQALRRDAERLDWMEKNLFSREPDDWDSKHGICKGGKNWMWAVFAPSGVQGGARRIIDAAIEAERGGA